MQQAIPARAAGPTAPQPCRRPRPPPASWLFATGARNRSKQPRSCRAAGWRSKRLEKWSTNCARSSVAFRRGLQLCLPLRPNRPRRPARPTGTPVPCPGSLTLLPCQGSALKVSNRPWCSPLNPGPSRYRVQSDKHHPLVSCSSIDVIFAMSSVSFCSIPPIFSSNLATCATLA